MMIPGLYSFGPYPIETYPITKTRCKGRPLVRHRPKKDERQRKRVATKMKKASRRKNRKK